jgi:hypothetical protein
MKKGFLKIIILCFSLLLTAQVFGQTVQVCISINGTAMPASKLYKMCKQTTLTIPGQGASTATLSLTNCAAVPEANVTYKWKNLSIAPFTDSLHSVITVKDTGKWEATIIDNVTLISYTDTLHLVYYPIISVVMGEAVANTCPLTPGYLTTTITGPVATYAWYAIPPSSVIPGETSSSYTFYTKNESYAVVVKDVNSCANSDTSTYYFQNPTVIQVALKKSYSNPVCQVTTTYLTDSVGYGYNLSTGGAPSYTYGIDNTPVMNVSITSNYTGPAPPIDITSILAPGVHKYWLRVDHFPQCSGADTVTFTVVPKPVVDIPGLDTILACYGNNTTINSTVLVGTPPYTYTWSPGSFPSSPSLVISPTSPTTYVVSVTDANNCSNGTDTLLVNVTPQLFVVISNDTTICRYPLGTAPLTTAVSGGTAPYTFAWSPMTDLTNPVNTPTHANITARPLTTTTYTMTATDNHNCTSSNAVKITSYQPLVAPIASPTTISETKTATLDASFAGNTGSNFLWKRADNIGTPLNSASLYLEYQGPDTVRYVAIVTNPANGCENHDTIDVWSISDNTLLYVPNIFSPNAVNPENQKFRIYGDNLAPDNFKILVYNKWGNVVYESTDLMDTKTNGWDGGTKMEGVYTYVIVGKFKNGKDVNESKFNKGTFSLIK